MTIVVTPSVNQRIDPDRIEKALDGSLPDCVLGTALVFDNPSGLNFRVGTGTIFLKGYCVQITVAETITLADNATNYIYVQLVRNGNSQVIGAQLTSNITGSTPNDAMLVATQITSGGVFTTTSDYQPLRENDNVIILHEIGAAPASSQLHGKIYLMTNGVDNQILKAKIYANNAFREVIAWGE